MADKVLIKQFRNKAKKPVAGLTPEHAVYDANGVRLDAKLGNVNLQEMRDLQQQGVNAIKNQETQSIQAVAAREAEILAKSDAAEVSFDNTSTSLMGTNVQDVLEETNSSINQLKNAGYIYTGIATPTTNPGTPDGHVFYIANGKGTYTNFGGIDITEDEIVILYYDTNWHKITTGIASYEKLIELNEKVNSLALGKFYGYFPNSSSLPVDITISGYAYVGLDSPYKIWNFNGESWSDSGTSIDINDADEEDITRNANGKLKFKDRVYGDGMGYIILRKNKSFAEQVTKENTIYEIRYGHEVGGTESSPIVIPNNCILKFCGGYLKDGYINVDNCLIKAGLYQIFDESLTVKGKNIISAFIGFPEWFGAKADGKSDDTIPMQKCIDAFEKTELTGHCYKITSVYLNAIGLPFGRKLLNRSIVNCYGNGICLDAYSELSGGEVHVFSNAIGITIGKEDDEMAHPRISVHDIKIVSHSNDNTYGIKCIAKEEGVHYNDFAFITNINIYGCTHGFYGNIRASFINISLEGCYDNFNGTNCSLNTIILTGNASTAIEEYPDFITIKGELNTIFPNIYDIGNPGFQKNLINIDGVNNKVINPTATVKNSDVTNSFSNPYFVNGFLEIKNPLYTVIYNNVRENPELLTLFDPKHEIDTSLYLINSEEDGYVEFQFGKVFGFVGVEFLHSISNAAFSKIEVRRNSIDENSFLTITNKGYSNHTSIFSNTYYDFWNPDSAWNGQWNDNLSIRCYIDKKTRVSLLGAKFYAKTATSKLNYGLLNDAPTPINMYEQYFATDIKENRNSKGSLMTWNGNEFISSNGETVDKVKKVYERLHPEEGIYHFCKITIHNIGNPVYFFLPIKYFGGVDSTVFHAEFILSISGDLTNQTYKISKIVTNSYTLTCYIYSKYENNSITFIIGFKRINGYFSYIDLGRAITNQVYSVEDLNNNVNIEGYTTHEFTLFDVYRSTNARETITENLGYCVFDYGLHKPLWQDEGKWVDSEGIPANVINTGLFIYRPMSNHIKIGYAYFCTDRKTVEGNTDGIMIYYKGNDVWVDALGRVVT